MIDSFAKLNLLDSNDITDVHHYSKLESKQSGDTDSETITYDFCSLDDIKHADSWPHEHFDYKLNKHGFRFGEIPVEADMAAFGCSFTFGTGLPEHMIWHNILAKERNETCLNFGIGGASIKTITDVFCIVSKHIKIKKAIFLLPSIPRIQLAKKHPVSNEIDYLSVIPGHDSKLCKYYDIDSHNFYKYLPEEEMYKITRDHIYLTELLASIRGIEVYYSSWDPDTYAFLKQINFNHGKLLPNWWTPLHLIGETARDKSHPGPAHHKYWSNRIKNYIK